MTKAGASSRQASEDGMAKRCAETRESDAERRKRVSARIDEPKKHRTFSSSDIAERAQWDDDKKADEEAIRATAAPHALWYVVPADQKWFSRLVVSAALIVTRHDRDLAYLRLPPEERAKVDDGRKAVFAGKR